jgi:hypothetical protein
LSHAAAGRVTHTESGNWFLARRGYQVQSRGSDVKVLLQISLKFAGAIYSSKGFEWYAGSLSSSVIKLKLLEVGFDYLCSCMYIMLVFGCC